MKRALLCFVVMLCMVSLVRADQGIRSLQQTLKDRGFYYGTVTGNKSAETTAALRRYQIRNGLKVTGEINEETLRSVNSNAVASASQPSSKPATNQPNSVRPDANARLSQSSPLPSQPSSKTATVQPNSDPPDASARLSQSSPPPTFNQPDGAIQTNPPYSASFYQSAPLRMNRRTIAGAQYQLMNRGYYRGRVDGKYGRQMWFALRAFQFNAGLPPTGHLDIETAKALGSFATDFANSASASPGDETWMPLTKFKHGKWKVKWKKYHRSFGGEDSEDRQANSEAGWNPYNQ